MGSVPVPENEVFLNFFVPHTTENEIMGVCIWPEAGIKSEYLLDPGHTHPASESGSSAVPHFGSAAVRQFCSLAVWQCINSVAAVHQSGSSDV